MEIDEKNRKMSRWQKREEQSLKIKLNRSGCEQEAQRIKIDLALATALDVALKIAPEHRRLPPLRCLSVASSVPTII